MSLPANWNTVTVTATFLRADTGGAAAGNVCFTPQRAIGMDSKEVLPNPITATLNSSGEISVGLPCPDDAAAGNTTLFYRVQERIPFGRDYYIQLDNTMTSIGLFEVPQVSAPAALLAAFGRVVVLTAAEYAALNPPDPDTLYAVTA